MPSPQPPKFYVTGGIFNQAERRELDEIAALLEESGFETYVPHRDGFEFSALKPLFQQQGYSDSEAESLLGKIIFANDVFQVIHLDGVVFNMNGRVPDDGATVESTMTWMAGNCLCIYKDDCRCLMDGIDNPLIDGLVDFAQVHEKEKIPAALNQWLNTHGTRTLADKLEGLAPKPRQTYENGKIFDALRKQEASLQKIADKAIEIFKPSLIAEKLV